MTEKHPNQYLSDIHVLNPLKNYAEEVQKIEYRRDELTSLWTIIQRSGYFKELFKSNPKFVRELAESTRERCPFCPPLEKSTPKFPPSIWPEGRLKVGKCVAVPNLFSHIDFNSIVVLGEKHYLPLDRITPEILFDGLTAGNKALKEIGMKKLGIKFGTIIMNYLPPAGSSIFHPHLQVLGAAKQDFNFSRFLVEKSRSYYERKGKNYWHTLMDQESDKFLMRSGKIYWYVPFAPLGSYEIGAVVENKGNIIELSEIEIGDLAKGLTTIFGYYHKIGISSLNMAIYSSSLEKSPTDYFLLNLRINARAGLSVSGVNDVWSLPLLLKEGISFTPPEELAQEVMKVM